MSTELSNGVIIPEEYSDDWYDEMSINLRKLNDVITAASDNATDIQRLDTAKANQSDLTALTSRVSQNETDIIALQTAVSGALKREIVQTLPTEDISTTTIYMIRNSQSSGTNIYDEYMYINSQWELIGTSATDFSNYYTKTETDNLLSGKVDNSTLGSYYTKTESDNLLSAKANQTDLTALGGRVTQTETDITALQTAVSGALKREIVQTLPTQDISTTTIYMIRNTTTSGDNIYDEYMYINNLWELIGTSATDFSNYYTKTEIDTLLSGKANDNSVVHTNRNDDVSIPLNSTSAELGVTGGSTNVTFLDKNDKKLSGLTFGNYGSSKLSYVRLSIFDKDVNDNEIQDNLEYAYVSNNNNAYLRVGRNDFCSLGTTSFRWKGVYATNYYYGSNNVEFSTKFVTTDTNQTITITKTFSSGVRLYNSNSSENTPSIILRTSKVSRGSTTDGGDSQSVMFNDRGDSLLSSVRCTKVSNGTTQLRNIVNTTDTSNNIITCETQLNIAKNGDKSFVPSEDSQINLGSSSYRWKSFNGLTPSSLSLPSTTGVVDISSYITDLTGTANTYTTLVNGYIQFDVTGSSVEIDVTNGLSQKWIMTDPKGFIPVVSGASVSIKVVGTAINNFKFIPCLGNI